ncbi:hypothetical protein, partial [Streptomyces mirabilis]
RRNVTPDTARNLTTAGVELPETAIKEQSGRKLMSEEKYLKAAHEWNKANTEWDWRKMPMDTMQPVEKVGNVPLGRFFYNIRENGREVLRETAVELKLLGQELPETAIREQPGRRRWTEKNYVAAAAQWDAGHPEGWNWKGMPKETMPPVEKVGNVPLGRFFYDIRENGRKVSQETVKELAKLGQNLPKTAIQEQPGRRMWTEEDYVDAARQWDAGHPDGWKWEDVPQDARLTEDVGKDGKEVGNVPLGRFFYDIRENGRKVSQETVKELAKLGQNLPKTAIQEQPGRKNVWSEEKYVEAARAWDERHINGWNWMGMTYGTVQPVEGVSVPLGRFFHGIKAGKRRVSGGTRNALNALSNLTPQLPDTVI